MKRGMGRRSCLTHQWDVCALSAACSVIQKVVRSFGLKLHVSA